MKATSLRISLAVAVYCTNSVQAQPSTVIPDAVSCAACTIVTRTVVSLGSVDGPGALSGPSSVMADSRGRYWVFSYGDLPMMFGADGRYLQVVGTKGEGPGEFQGAAGAFPIPGDSVVVLDGRNRRATIFGPDLKLGRMIRMEGNLAPDVVVRRWPDTVIAGGRIPTREAMHIPLHTASFTGSLTQMLRGFGGADSSEARSGNPAELVRPLSHAASGGAWAGELGRYRLTLWSAAGTKVRTIERKPSWFVPSNDLFMGNPTIPPPATMKGIREEPSSGLLWVFIAVPAATWQDAWPSRIGREIGIRSIAVEKLTDTRIEVLDPSTGRLVAVGSIPGIASLLRDGRAAVYTVDADGIPRMNIAELRLEGWVPAPRKPE